MLIDTVIINAVLVARPFHVPVRNDIAHAKKGVPTQQMIRLLLTISISLVNGASVNLTSFMEAGPYSAVRRRE